MGKKTDDLQELLFQHKNDEFVQGVIVFLGEVENLVKQFRDFKVAEFNNCLQYIVIALENKDYLLVSDVLKYEILPFLTEMQEENVHDDL